MKKLFCCVLAICVLAACKKSELDKDVCIDQTTPAVRQVAADTLARVQALFNTNHLNANGLRFYGAILTDSVTLDGHLNVYQHIAALQYFNGLPLLNGDIGFHFKDGVYWSTIGTKYNSVALDNKPKSSANRIANQFLKAAAGNTYAAGLNLADSCLTVTFGYYNTNNTSTATNPVFIKVWRVTPKGRSYPVGYFKDENAETMWFFDGIFTAD